MKRTDPAEGSSCSCFSPWSDQEKINRLPEKQKEIKLRFIYVRLVKLWEMVTKEIMESPKGLSLKASNHYISIIKNLALFFRKTKQCEVMAYQGIICQVNFDFTLCTKQQNNFCISCLCHFYFVYEHAALVSNFPKCIIKFLSSTLKIFSQSLNQCSAHSKWESTKNIKMGKS